MKLVDDYGAGRLDYYQDLILRMSLADLMNDGRIGPRADRLLWRLESALTDLPMGRLLEMLERGPYLEAGRLHEVRAALADEAMGLMERDNDGDRP